MAFFVEVGLLLLILPWSGFWEQNYFAGHWSWMLRVITNNYVRGAISGLGVVNLAAGFAELGGAFSAAHPRQLSVEDPTRGPL